MEIHSTQEQLQIFLNQDEVRFLADVLESLKQKYQIPPELMDSKTSSVWYSMKGCSQMEMSEEDREEWLLGLQQHRTEYQGKMDGWLKCLKSADPEASLVLLEIPFTEVEMLLSILNDHRLAMAAVHEVGQGEMEHDLEKVEDPIKRSALFQIHFLGWMMERIIGEVSDL